MTPTVEEIVKGLSDPMRATLEDLCSCPGLFAGQYEDLDRLPAALIDRRYQGAAGFMGLAKAWPSSTGLSVRTYLESMGDGR